MTVLQDTCIVAPAVLRPAWKREGSRCIWLPSLGIWGEFKNIERIMDRIQNAPMDLIGGNRDFGL